MQVPVFLYMINRIDHRAGTVIGEMILPVYLPRISLYRSCCSADDVWSLDTGRKDKQQER